MRTIIFLFIAIGMLVAQPTWKPRPVSAPVITNLFHSGTGVLLPTNTTLNKFESQLDIIHHFYPFVKDGWDALFGLDGPVVNRFAFHFAPVNNFMVTVARSNQLDNYSVEFHATVFRVYDSTIPFDMGIHGGLAWNSQIIGRDRLDKKNFQYFGQMIITAMPDKKLAVGLVPGFVINAVPVSENTLTQVNLGILVQPYLTKMVSLPVEFIPVLSKKTGNHTFSAGLELETGGHFFKIFVTNNVNTNPVLALSGADADFLKGDIRFGFTITRLLMWKKNRE